MFFWTSQYTVHIFLQSCLLPEIFSCCLWILQVKQTLWSILHLGYWVNIISSIPHRRVLHMWLGRMLKIVQKQTGLQDNVGHNTWLQNSVTNATANMKTILLGLWSEYKSKELLHSFCLRLLGIIQIEVPIIFLELFLEPVRHGKAKDNKQSGRLASLIFLILPLQVLLLVDCFSRKKYSHTMAYSICL